MKRTFLACVFFLNLSGCEFPPLQGEAQSNSAAAVGKSSDWLLAKASWLTIEVHKGGILAKVGHDHILASHELTGQMSINRTVGHVRIPLNSLTIDESVLRQKLGWEPIDSEQSIKGTRRNMNRYVLQPDRFSDVVVDVQCPVPFHNTCHVSIHLHGMTQEIADMPMQIKETGNQVVVTGSSTLLQTDYGIKPFSVLGGGLRVENPVLIRYYLVFEKSGLPD